MADQDRRYIYPAKGATVRNPDMSMQPVPETGVEVVWNQGWQQLLHFGDISVETEDQKVKRVEREQKAIEQAKRDHEQAERDARKAEREAKAGEQADKKA